MSQTVPTSAEAVRPWPGPALLSYGFRPFFLGAALWAALSMALWLAMLSGAMLLPTRFDPVTWHAHEFLFGYLGAVFAGFFLTAIPNWTGRPPMTGWPLAGLFALWLMGRFAIATSSLWSPLAVALVDLVFGLVFAAVVTREIIAGRNWRNLVVVVLFGVFWIGNAFFHWEAARYGYAAQGLGARIGLAATITLIALIGGRIVPTFTRNWLTKRGDQHLPAPPMGPIDKIAMLLLLAALVIWVVQPYSIAAGVALLLAGAVHAVRLARWSGHRTGAEPLVWVLHAGYAFVPVGAMMLGFSVLRPDLLGFAAAQHVWMAGGIGLMTLAVMTRATLGHTGQALTASPGTTGVYLLIIVAVIARLLSGPFPDNAGLLHVLSGLAWLAAFAGFVLLYGRLLITPRNGEQHPS